MLRFFFAGSERGQLSALKLNQRLFLSSVGKFRNGSDTQCVTTTRPIRWTCLSTISCSTPTGSHGESFTLAQVATTKRTFMFATKAKSFVFLLTQGGWCRGGVLTLIFALRGSCQETESEWGEEKCTETFVAHEPARRALSPL